MTISGSKTEVLERLNRDFYLFDHRPLLLKKHDRWVVEKVGSFEKQLGAINQESGSVFFHECITAGEQRSEYVIEMKSIKIKLSSNE